MKTENLFAVSLYENRNGASSWRVAGWLHGVRIRKNYKTKEEAAAAKAVLELNALQTTSRLRPIATALNEDQVREAEAAFRRIAGQLRSLSQYLDYALANYRAPATQQPLADAIKAYLAMKTREQEQQLISAPQLKTIQNHLAVLQRHFQDSTVSDLTHSRLIAYCQTGHPSLKTYNNRRGVVSTFYDRLAERSWGHLSVMQYRLELRCAVPRCDCSAPASTAYGRTSTLTRKYGDCSRPPGRSPQPNDFPDAVSSSLGPSTVCLDFWRSPACVWGRY
jgi:hypothetical protein